MIGFLLVVLAVLSFLGIGYALLMGTFMLFMNVVIIVALIGMALACLCGLLWEFYFQKPAKTIIANRRCGAWEWVADDLGWAELLPSRQYMPQGLVKWRYGWSLLPRPVMKLGLDVMGTLTGKKRGKPRKDAEDEKQAQEQHRARQQQLLEVKRKEDELAERIGLKKSIWRGMGKPVWFQYLGLAANFNPDVLASIETTQDNPSGYISQMRDYVKGLASLPYEVRQDLLQKVDDLETRLEHVRVVIDPRRFKELHPKMYTQSQIDDHGRVHEEIGRLSVNSIPMKYIVIIILVVIVIAAIAGVYFLFGPKQTGSPQGLMMRLASALIG